MLVVEPAVVKLQNVASMEEYGAYLDKAPHACWASKVVPLRLLRIATVADLLGSTLGAQRVLCGRCVSLTYAKLDGIASARDG